MRLSDILMCTYVDVMILSSGACVCCQSVFPVGRIRHRPRLREQREEQRTDAAGSRPADVSARQPEPGAAAGDHPRYTEKTTCVHSTTHAHRSVTEFLSSLCLLVSGYNDMKSELKDFLQRFAAEGKVSLRLKTDDVM